LVPRDFTTNAAALNARWCGDITYVPDLAGLDLTRNVDRRRLARVVGFAMAEHLRTELVADALCNASPPAILAAG
jgi:transposase InsO family protein